MRDLLGLVPGAVECRAYRQTEPSARLKKPWKGIELRTESFQVLDIYSEFGSSPISPPEESGASGAALTHQ